MFVLFVVLIAGPIVAGKFVGSSLSSIPDQLAQPANLVNNNTNGDQTGTSPGASGAAATASSGSGSDSGSGVGSGSGSSRLLLRNF